MILLRKIVWQKYVFLAPGFLLYIAVVVFPACYTFFLSFFDWNGVSEHKKFVGLMNYINSFRDHNFINAVMNNFKWCLMTILITVSCALILATILNAEFKGRILFRGIFYFPYILSRVVAGIIWKWIYQPQFGLLVSLGLIFNIGFLQIPYLAEKDTALYAVFIAALWQSVGYPMVLFLSGLQTISPEYMEAAEIDGANRIQKFFKITIPMLKEVFVIVFATQIIQSVLVYDVITSLAGDGSGRSTTVLSMLMIQQSFRFTKLGLGATTAVFMVLMASFIVIPYVLFMIRDERVKKI